MPDEPRRKLASGQLPTGRNDGCGNIGGFLIEPHGTAAPHLLR